MRDGMPGSGRAVLEYELESKMQKPSVVSATACWLACIGLLAMPAAMAGELSGEAFPALSSIQWSTAGQPTYAQYNVVIQNTSTPTISGWRFMGRTSVAGGTTTASFYAAGSDSRCVANNSAGTEVVCSFEPLASGAQMGFSIAFNGPADGNQIDFSWRVFWDESGSGGNDGFRSAAATGLYAPNDSQVSSVVPSQAPALTFFTGGGIATVADSWVTRVTVPANVSTSTTATVSETVTPGGCAADLLTCNTSTLDIPGSFASLLEIMLRRDASTIAKGAKIDSARIYYQHTSTSSEIEVPACTDSSYGTLPQPGIPCEDRTLRKAYPKKSTPKSPVPAGFEGDWEFVIRAVDNGRYTN
jgi:hypothetical protein